MPELRRDPIVGRWVIISTERSKRPGEFKRGRATAPEDGCPFCEGNESQTSGEVFAVRSSAAPANSPGWQVRVFSSRQPALNSEGELERAGEGMFDMMNAVGAHEVIVECPSHVQNTADLTVDQIARVVGVYAERMHELETDTRMKYVLAFKNHGVQAGATTISHAHSHLIAMPVNPKQVKKELVGARRYFEYKERCIFCDIIREETETEKAAKRNNSNDSRVVLETDRFLCFCPFCSRFPYEIWILPKKHSCDFSSIDHDDSVDLAKALKSALTALKLGLDDPPYNYVIHTAPFRRQGRPGYWKSIDQDFHWHIEIIPRLTQVAGFEWGSGFYINPVPPEQAAGELKKRV